jgi:long-chain fatty acid transport protein
MNRRVSVAAALIVLCAAMIVSTPVFATNGMNLEGYGPIATGMGGASMAYDNGTAAMMNNPATLGLMGEGNRLDLAFGYLGPHISASMPGSPDAKSSADAFFMPAIGWSQRSGQYTYGVGVFSQGGMGTDFDANSFLAMGSGDKVRSELGVGRIIVPIAYNVNNDLTIAASLDYVWASLDLKMAMQMGQMLQLVNMSTSSGPMLSSLATLTSSDVARLDFSGGGSFSGAAKGTGFAEKIGAVYKVNPAVVVGATYHTKTMLSDLQTSGEGADFSVPAYSMVVPGKISVRDFQWPATTAVGVAWQASKDVLVAFDLKQIYWKDVMKDFKMTFEGNGSTINFALPQNWKDHNVIQIGAGYTVNPEWVVLAGLNIADNPIPDTYLNPLFPATEKTHVTVGAGYTVSKASSVDASFTYAPEVSQTTNMTMYGPGGTSQVVPVTVKHNQTNAQVMYSYRF